MADLVLQASLRQITGRHVHAGRREGHVPAVLYGHNLEPVNLATEARSLTRVWRRAGRTHLVDLVVDGGKARKVLIKEFQIDPRSALPLHADFFAVNLKEKLTAEVPVVITGSSPAVDELKLGQLLQPLAKVTVECLPQDLPAHLAADVSGLTEIDAHILIRDLELPKGVTLVHADLDEVVVKVAAMRVQEEEPEVAAAAPEADAAAPAPSTETE